MYDETLYKRLGEGIRRKELSAEERVGLLIDVSSPSHILCSKIHSSHYLLLGVGIVRL
jgi:hypothetical protein